MTSVVFLVWVYDSSSSRVRPPRPLWTRVIPVKVHVSRPLCRFLQSLRVHGPVSVSEHPPWVYVGNVPPSLLYHRQSSSVPRSIPRVDPGSRR